MGFIFNFLILLGTFGTTEIVVIVILALLLFGGKKIPELMRGLGTGLKEFKKASESDNDSDSNSDSKK
ncbi:Sec-independent protein translocase subunit TatA/TatB [Blattabacterium cuenoti]|uniref:Sec-independent protein translocase subunit TatA/TatB n=1 Tax=Blattabacterium cuenoti TaxID=1653831 RepID=UPI00163B721D|nr:twin-arginine translocase TatA/TatE family subunit [Blattabacterium cuenoti]